MACYHPIRGYRSREGVNKDTGKWPIVFDVKYGHVDMAIDIPCGQCIGCRLERSRQWAVRCIHEASLYDRNCFITLTYNNQFLPKNGSLNKRDFVLFMKRLRKRHGVGIRFFQCGEYGANCSNCGMNKRDCQVKGCRNWKEGLGRPHHHAILFNHDFDDKILFRERPSRLYISDDLQKLWPYGFTTVGDVTFESSAYVARYILKKVNGRNSKDHYGEKTPEYITMSRRPGIAYDWISQFKDDVYPHDYVVIRDGIKCRPPQYYDAFYDLTDSKKAAYLRFKRRKKAKENDKDSSPQRLHVREQIQRLRAEKLVREL